jgi:predicted flap endonuclease-1-like 5' DNA nuclease
MTEEERMTKLEHIEGIGTRYAGQLRKAGVGSSKTLLKRGATAAGRRKIAQLSGISEKLVLEWVNHVDLFRVTGIGEEYADLLEEAGVDTVPELAQRNFDNLHQQLMDINRAKNLVRRPPSRKMVFQWVRQAGKLPRVIEY